MQKKLENIQKIIDEGELSKENQLREKEIYLEIHKNNRNEEETWRLKSRNFWIHFGDKNTAFFHNTTKMRFFKKCIESIIREGGVDIKSREGIKRKAHQHYKRLIASDQEEQNYEDFVSYIPKLIIEETNDALTKEVDEDEIQEVIWSLQLEKVSSPDGFSISFYSSFWQFIKKDLLKMIH